jgi:anti-sigma factor RsiW
MNCRDVREIADSFLCEELLTETNHEILRHLETCPVCRTEIDGRRRLRGALRDAFNRAPELQPSAEFQTRLRDQLRDVSAHGTRSWSLSRRLLALAAGVVLAVGVTGIVLMKRTAGPTEALARDAVGDHQNCALKYRLVRMPVPLEEAAQQFDSAYRLLLSTPPEDTSIADGVARVTERHSCAYGARRFGHVIMEYRGHVVSLLVTTNDGETGNVGQDAIPHLIGRPVNGLSVVSVNGTHHAVLLVSDLGSTELAQLSRAVSVPLARRLEVSLMPDRGSVASRQFERPFQSLTLNSVDWPGSDAACLPHVRR